MHRGKKPALMGVAGVGLEEAAIIEIAGVEADETAGTFDFYGHSRCRVGHQQAGIVNDSDLIERDVARDGRCERLDLELRRRAGCAQFIRGNRLTGVISNCREHSRSVGYSPVAGIDIVGDCMAP